MVWKQNRNRNTLPRFCPGFFLLNETIRCNENSIRYSKFDDTAILIKSSVSVLVLVIMTLYLKSISFAHHCADHKATYLPVRVMILFLFTTISLKAQQQQLQVAEISQSFFSLATELDRHKITHINWDWDQERLDFIVSNGITSGTHYRTF